MHICMTLRIIWSLLVLLVEYLFQEVASHFHLRCLHPQLVYNPTFLVFGARQFGFQQLIPALLPLTSTQLDLEFA